MEWVWRTIPNQRARAAPPCRLPTAHHRARWWTLLGLLLACPAGAEEVVVGAAASLREPLLRIGSAFQTEHGSPVAFSFGASSGVAAQIRLGAPVDVFLSADERQVASLASDGLVPAGTGVVFASNALVLIASPRRKVPIAGPDDLAQAGLRRFALPAPAVPLGHYARAWLARRGLIDALGTRIVQTSDARATLAAVELGQADAALVYATDARLARRAQLVFTPPPPHQPRIVYVAALTTHGDAKSAAHSFLAFLLGPGGSELEAAGFLPPRGAP